MPGCKNMSHLAKYKNRPSPPYPAANCPGASKTGNAGRKYKSVPDKNGRYAWKPSPRKSPRKSARKSKAPRKSPRKSPRDELTRDKEWYRRVRWMAKSKTLKWLQANPGIENTIIKYQQDNPKTGASRQKYEKYKHAKTIGEFVKLGGWKDDFDWDRTKKFLTVYFIWGKYGSVYSPKQKHYLRL